MTPFSEDLRYQYDLTPDSVVFNCGGYDGAWAKAIIERYGCKVHVFEPVPKFFIKCQENLERMPAEIYLCGVGGTERKVQMRVKGEMSGSYADDGPCFEANLCTIRDLMNGLALDRIDLLELNIEGGEFETIEAMLKDGTIKRIVNLQVQPHPVVPDCEVRWTRIMEELAKTHELMWHAPWCWESWRIRK